MYFIPRRRSEHAAWVTCKNGRSVLDLAPKIWAHCKPTFPPRRLVEGLPHLGWYFRPSEQGLLICTGLGQTKCWDRLCDGQAERWWEFLCRGGLPPCSISFFALQCAKGSLMDCQTPLHTGKHRQPHQKKGRRLETHLSQVTLAKGESGALLMLLETA